MAYKYRTPVEVAVPLTIALLRPKGSADNRWIIEDGTRVTYEDFEEYEVRTIPRNRFTLGTLRKIESLFVAGKRNITAELRGNTCMSLHNLKIKL